jgi:Ca2+-dependent lipid-binding protein
MPTESIYLSDVLRRLDRQDQDIHKLAREVSELKASGDAWHVEMRGTVKSNFDFFKDVTTTTQTTVGKLEELVKEATASANESVAMTKVACDAANLAANSKSKTEKAYDKAMFAIGAGVLSIVTAFGAPWLASNEDFWDTVWLAIKGVVKAKSG